MQDPRGQGRHHGERQGLSQDLSHESRDSQSYVADTLLPHPFLCWSLTNTLPVPSHLLLLRA